MQGFAKFLEDGGTFMYFNLCTSIIVLSIIVDRLIFFLVKSSVNARAFLDQIRKLVLANNIDRAVKLCSATTAPVAQVAKAGLQRIHRGEIAVAQAIEESLVDVTPMIKKRIQILWSLANIATLIGLLGTVTGTMKSLGVLGKFGAVSDPSILAGGLSEALINTVSGIAVAVVATIFYNYLVGKANTYLLRLEGQVNALILMINKNRPAWTGEERRASGAGGSPAAAGAV